MVADGHEPPTVDSRGPPELGQVAPGARRRNDRQVTDERDRGAHVVGLPPRDTGPTHPSRADGEHVERIRCPALRGQRHPEQGRRGQMAEDLVIAHEGKKSGTAVNEMCRVERSSTHTVMRSVEVAPTHPSVRNTR